MRLLFAVLLMIGVLGSASAADFGRITDDEFHNTFEASYSEAQLCVADIKFANTVKIPDDYVKIHLTKAVDTRCTNVVIGLYNMTKTPNQLEDYVGTDEVRKNKFDTMKLGVALFVEVVKSTGWEPFPNFKKAWDQITNPKPAKDNTI